MSNSISLIIKKISKLPWIYQFFDKDSKIIYIWKSVNLKSRVSSYFNDKNKLNFAKKQMVKQIVDIKTIITNNETESLILENTLIKKYKPKYNILLKDDKNHLYVKITNEAIPRIIKTRIKTQGELSWKDNRGYPGVKSWKYFWPYISTGYVNNILRFLKKSINYRSCNIIFWKENNKVIIKKTNWVKIPCIDYYIKTCSWPCLLEDEKTQKYIKDIEKIKDFLKWDFKETTKKLEEDMKIEAKKLNFEKAKEIKDLIESINSLSESQIVRDLVNWDYDIINYIEKYNKTYIWHIEIKDGKIVWFFSYEIKSKLKETIDEKLKIFIERKKVENIHKWIKGTFVIPTKIEIEDTKIEVPEIWAKLDLLKLCYKNIYNHAYKKHLDSLSTKWFSKKTMEDLLDIVWYKKINKSLIFECNDISHLSWAHTVASRSVIENWKTNSNKYRKFRIKTLEDYKIDDFASLKEIIERRLNEILKTSIVPDLIIIDWWKGQLSSTIKILNIFKENNPEHIEILNKIQIISIAKKEEELFLPWEKESIILKKDSNKLRLVQKLRDEAHRFAIDFNRKSRIKSMKRNILESLPWFWPITRKKILRSFWSVEKLSDVNKVELAKILNKNQIETLEDHGII